MLEGRVKWFHDPKGYGFIVGEDKIEYFAHYTRINGEGRKSLKEAERVSFEPRKEPKGNCAFDIKTLDR